MEVVRPAAAPRPARQNGLHAFTQDGQHLVARHPFVAAVEQQRGVRYALQLRLRHAERTDLGGHADAERHSEHEDQDKKGNYVRCERSYGSYQRAFDISGVEVADISAQYNDGVLKLNMPKKSAVMNAKQIEIQ